MCGQMNAFDPNQADSFLQQKNPVEIKCQNNNTNL